MVAMGGTTSASSAAARSLPTCLFLSLRTRSDWEAARLRSGRSIGMRHDAGDFLVEPIKVLVLAVGEIHGELDRATSTRTACIVSLWRKTSTGKIPTGRGLALPNFSFARAVSAYGLAETVNPSCLSCGRRRQILRWGIGLSRRELRHRHPRTPTAPLPRVKVRVELRMIGCLSLLVRCPGTGQVVRVRAATIARIRHLKSAYIAETRAIRGGHIFLDSRLPACKLAPRCIPSKLGGVHLMASRREFLQIGVAALAMPISARAGLKPASPAGRRIRVDAALQSDFRRAIRSEPRIRG